jgi:hypothetical protein
MVTIYSPYILHFISSSSRKRVLLHNDRDEGDHHHPLLRLWEGEDGEDTVRCFNATSAASSFALLTCCPSYQNLAEIFWPWTVTVLDQAVRPPIYQCVN